MHVNRQIGRHLRLSTDNGKVYLVHTRVLALHRDVHGAVSLPTEIPIPRLFAQYLLVDPEIQVNGHLFLRRAWVVDLDVPAVDVPADGSHRHIADLVQQRRVAQDWNHLDLVSRIRLQDVVSVEHGGMVCIAHLSLVRVQVNVSIRLHLRESVEVEDVLPLRNQVVEGEIRTRTHEVAVVETVISVLRPQCYHVIFVTPIRQVEVGEVIGLHIEEDVVKDHIGIEYHCSVFVASPPREEAEELFLVLVLQVHVLGDAFQQRRGFGQFLLVRVLVRHLKRQQKVRLRLRVHSYVNRLVETEIALAFQSDGFEPADLSAFVLGIIDHRVLHNGADNQVSVADQVLQVDGQCVQEGLRCARQELVVEVPALRQYVPVHLVYRHRLGLR